MEKKILTLIKKLVTIESTKDKPAQLKEIVETALSQLSEFTVERFEKNEAPSALVYAGEKRPAQFKIILNAHLDVVAGLARQFTPYEKNGRLYGRGASDMKGATAAEILVFKELAHNLSYPLGLQLVTDEETGGFHGTKHQVEKGVRADFVIAGEPTDFGINNKAKGIIWAKIKAQGKSAHGAYPWEGENAIALIAKAAGAIIQQYPTPATESWETTYNLSWIKTTNQTVNKVPDAAELQLDIRYIPEDKDTVITTLKKLLPKKITLEVQLQEPSQYTDENSEYVQELAHAAKKIIGKKPPIIAKHGGSDIRHFNVVGCNGVTFGPIGSGLHTDNEWVDVKSLATYYTILKKFLLTLNKSQ